MIRISFSEVCNRKSTQRSTLLFHNNMNWKYLGKLTKSDYYIIKRKDSMLIIRSGGTFLPTPGHVRVKSVNKSMVLTDVTSTEVRNVIASLKNSSSGHDEFPPFVGNSCVDAFIEPLTHLINLSLRSGVFPSELKLAKVVPIFKAGDTSAINNYRPIFVLSFFPKFLKKLFTTMC